MQIYSKGANVDKPNSLTPAELAFVGDAVHTLFVRQHILQKGGRISNINRVCAKYCSAVCQSKVLERVHANLDEKENEIVRRGRNFASKTRAKNASVEEYRNATAFETLVGFLYLEKNTERLQQILDWSVEEI